MEASTSYGQRQYGSAFAGGSGMYGGSYGMGGMGGYGGGLYGNRYGSYGTGGYMGGSYMGSGYGSMYGSGYGSMYGGMGGMGYGGMGGYGMGMGMNGMNGMQPGMQGGPPAPPSGWQTFLRALHSAFDLFGRLAFLVDENVHALNFFISAILMLVDRSGSLYAEMARFVLRMLGLKIPASLRPQPPPGPPGPHGNPMMGQVQGLNGTPVSGVTPSSAVGKEKLDNFWPKSS